MADYTWLYHPIPRGPQRLPSCCICNDAVPLETSNTDEYGQAVHEECYVLKVCFKAEFLYDRGSVPGQAYWHAIDPHGEGTMAEGWESPMPRQPAVLATMRMQQARRIPWFNRPWKVDMGAVVAVLVVACWIAYSDRGPASFLRSSRLQRSIAIEGPLPPQKAMPAKDRFMFQAVSGSVEQARTTTRLQRVGFAENEVFTSEMTLQCAISRPNPRHMGFRSGGIKSFTSEKM
jgi:hypothetical protein